MDRSVLLDRPAVQLAGGELVVEGRRYAIADVRSARVVRMPKAATGPILMIGTGVVSFFSIPGEAGMLGAGIGAALVAGALVWWRLKKPSWQVTLATPGGDEMPFESEDEATARRVLDAIERARAAAERAA